ncbi:mycothiol transferase [Saccharopolyspora sp. CA-218241]|uniref:mycothiol transferase n=1 Tax=Saccharopolyspora sp. CA-218241 TaxID=3240027 RepID=UPI003D97EBC6
MTGPEVLLDAFSRIRETVHEVVDGLSPQDVVFRVDPEANTIAWLVWHLTRVQDDHVAELAEQEQAWARFHERFGLPADATGFGDSPEDVAAVRVDRVALLTEYHDAVHQRTAEYLAGITDDDLDEVVDPAWDPPVTAGVRLVSVVGDDMQHVGQAAFVRGVLERGH